MTRNASSKKAATPVQAQLELGDTPDTPTKCCAKCQHYTGTYCNLVLPPFVRITENAMHRVTKRDFVCSFHTSKG